MARRRAEAPRRSSFAKHLVVMARSPVAGRVKRRLAREIGDVATIRFYRHCLSHAVLRLARDPRWHVVLAVDSDRDAAGSFWPPRKLIARQPQGGGDLARRMQRLFALLPPGPAIIVGSDVPAIQAAHIAEAFKLLGRADAVFGKAPDGGYWLIGLKRTPRVLYPFAGVRWSSAHALADTVANLARRPVAYAATLSDVDTSEDLRRERTHTERLISVKNAALVTRLI
jgi:rSAM/selenodomain-associated transferase 1